MPKSNKPISLPNASLSFSTATSSYSLILKPTTFVKAQKNAYKYGGYLAELSSSSENAQVFDSITGILESSLYNKSIASDGGGSSYLWIGGSDSASEGVWYWSKSGISIPLNSPEWGKGSMGQEPDNFGGGQDYLALALENWPYGSADNKGYGNAGMWNDIQGSNKLFYLVEFN
jgi:hypothetical protein